MFRTAALALGCLVALSACASAPRAPLTEHVVEFDNAVIPALQQTMRAGRFKAFLIFGDPLSDVVQVGPLNSSAGTVRGALNMCSQIYPREGRARHYLVVQIIHAGPEWGLTNTYRLPINHARVYPVQALQDDRYSWVPRGQTPKGFTADYIGETLERGQSGAFEKVYETRVRAANGSYAAGLPVRVRISEGLMAALVRIVERTPNTNQRHTPPCAPQTEFGFRGA